MRAASAVSATPPAAKKPDREGVLAVLQDQPTLDRVQGIIRELQLEDELTLEPTLDSALRRIREGGTPRVLVTSRDPQFKNVRPAWSPDGKEILVIGGSSSPTMDKPLVSELVFLEAASGRVMRRVPTAQWEIRQGRWLDRDRLVVETGAGDLSRLWVTNVRGEGWTPLTREFASLTNFAATAEALLARIQREAVGGLPDPKTQALLDEIRPDAPPDFARPASPVVPVHFVKDGLDVRYFSLVTTVGTPQDVTLQEIRVELFFPA